MFSGTGFNRKELLPKQHQDLNHVDQRKGQQSQSREGQFPPIKEQLLSFPPIKMQQLAEGLTRHCINAILKAIPKNAK